MGQINLQGIWSFALDPDNRGMDLHWFDLKLADTISLPGSTDENGYGEQMEQTDTFRLNRKRKYVGPAWYQTEVLIPETWIDKRIILFLERCMWETKVWVDGRYAGSEDSLGTPHKHNVSRLLTPGVHTLSIRVDNSAQVDLGTWSHGWSEEVQTIWNGIIGRVELNATDPVYLNRVRIFPDIANQKAIVKADVINLTGGTYEGTLLLNAGLQGQAQNITVSQTFTIKNELENIETEIALGNGMELWDEFDPHLYTVRASLFATGEGKTYSHSLDESFGMREFAADGPRFRLNDYYIFLRGTHDAGNFPLTGYPSMDKEEWLRIYRIGKSYGLNHFRFHSWCPPEAAFAAADEAGVILQAELPLFGNETPPIGKDALRDAFLKRELERTLDNYGNHPSFCMMCMGNELRGNYDILNQFAIEGKSKDPRRLYTTVANNAAEPSLGIKPCAGDEFYVAHEARVNGERHVRRCELTFNNVPPETRGDFAFTLESIDIPTVSHEVGQWEVYPNYREIDKYTGVLEPRNLQRFRSSLESNGLLDQADDFLKASGALSLLLYREEIERSLRTPNYGGFQLLDIHDYPGQGTALVGWLDAFWDSKCLIEPSEFRRFCDAVVLLLRLPKRVYTNKETVDATIDIANYNRYAMEHAHLEWSIKSSAGRVIGSGKLASIAYEQGAVTEIGRIEFPLHGTEGAEKLNIEVSIPGTKISNDWDIWVYPEATEAIDGSDVRIASVWDDEVERHLSEGGNVLFLAQSAKRSELASFTTPFWNTQMFPNQPKTMGLLCDPQHALFEKFPTDFHTNWQWWDLFNGARAIDLNGLPQELRPIVQAIDHPVRNKKMGLLFECAVGNGKLVVSGLDLRSRLEERPAARQLLDSVLQYMNGNQFRPSIADELADLRDRLTSIASNKISQHVKSMKASSTLWKFKAEHLIDGNFDTYWMSENNGYPHEIVIELQKEVPVKGFKYVPLQDGRETGWIADYEWYVCKDGINWGDPVARGSFQPHANEQQIEMEWVNDGFNTTRSKMGTYIRIVALSGFNGDKCASAVEIDIQTE